MQYDDGNSLLHPSFDLQGMFDAVGTILTIASSSESNSWQTALFVLFDDLPQNLNLVEPVETVTMWIGEMLPKWVTLAKGWGLIMFTLALFLILCYIFYDKTERMMSRVGRLVDKVINKIQSLRSGVKSFLKTWLNAQ